LHEGLASKDTRRGEKVASWVEYLACVIDIFSR
jgi:hypothetical protein